MKNIENVKLNKHTLKHFMNKQFTVCVSTRLTLFGM